MNPSDLLRLARLKICSGNMARQFSTASSKYPSRMSDSRLRSVESGCARESYI